YNEYILNILPKAKKELDDLQIKYKNKISIFNPFVKSDYQQDMLGRRSKLCEAAFTRMYIDNNGESYPCPLFKENSKMYCGNIFKDSLKQIWNSEAMNSLRNISTDTTGCSDCGQVCSYWCRAITYATTGSLSKHSILCRQMKL
ncbi:MAG: SPASM domain-containing protein, partial [Lutisporaceae bacterium]